MYSCFRFVGERMYLPSFYRRIQCPTHSQKWWMIMLALPSEPFAGKPYLSGLGKIWSPWLLRLILLGRCMTDWYVTMLWCVHPLFHLCKKSYTRQSLKWKRYWNWGHSCKKSSSIWVPPEKLWMMHLQKDTWLELWVEILNSSRWLLQLITCPIQTLMTL